MIGAHACHDVGADLPYRGVVVAEKPRLHFFLPGRAVLGRGPHQSHVAADVLAQQLLGLEQIVLIVLFEHGDARRLGDRPEVDGRRVHRRRDIHEAEVEAAAGELHVAHIAHESDVGVVDRHREIDLVVERGRVLRFRSGRGDRRSGIARETAPAVRMAAANHSEARMKWLLSSQRT